MSLYKTVFLADDDSDDREIFMDAIKAIDNTVRFISAKNGSVALETLQADIIEKPEIIFLDLNMPFMNGKELLREIKKIDSLRDIPVIMYSTFFAEEDIREFKRLGASHFILKPSQISTLITSLNSVLMKKW